MKKGQRKVYVVSNFYPYEGYSEPLGVFPSIAAAQKFVGEQQDHDELNVFELILDAK